MKPRTLFTLAGMMSAYLGARRSRRGRGAVAVALMISAFGVEPAVAGVTLCDYRLYAQAGNQVLAFPYCATQDLDSAAEFPDVRTLIISQHGRTPDGHAYLDIMTEAVELADTTDGLVNKAETFVIAPQFLAPSQADDAGISEQVQAGLFLWGGGIDNDYATGGKSLSGGESGQSSFAMLEQLVGKAIARMPNLREIIFAGQSAGGIFTQRYALLNNFRFPRGVHVRYVPANSLDWVYPTADRPMVGSDDFFQPLGDLSDPHPDPQVCPAAACPTYNNYWRGLDNIPVSHWAANHLPLLEGFILDPNAEYINHADVDAIGANYAGRDVTYLAGEGDILLANQCACGDQLQGEHVRARAEIISRYMKTRFGTPSHDAVIAPDVGHGGGIFKTQCGRAAIFGAPNNCTPLQDHNVANGWSGRILSIAYGNVDDDPADEMAIVERQTASPYLTRVLVLDDKAHNYGLLFVPSADWSSWQRGQAVAFGDVDGDGRDELAVGRATGSGDSWFVYDYNFDTTKTWTTVDSGGAEWDYPRTVGHVAFGDADGDGDDELAVTRLSTAGDRWFVYKYNAGLLLAGTDRIGLYRSSGSSWGDGIVPTGIAFGDVDGDFRDELAVSRDATSGARLYVYQLEYAGKSLEASAAAIGSDWTSGHIVRHIALGNADGDFKDEIALGVDSPPLYSRWLVLDDSLASYALVQKGGRDGDPGWTPGSRVTALAFDSIDRPASNGYTYYDTLAVAATTQDGPVLELVTFETANKTLKVGDYARPLVWGGVAIESLAFGDVDGQGEGGGGEIAYGVSNAAQAGLGIRVLAAP